MGAPAHLTAGAGRWKLALGEHPECCPALGEWEPVDEQHTVEMVDLVEQAAGEETTSLDAQRLAMDIQTYHLCRAGAGELGCERRDRQAALLAELLIRTCEYQAGVADHPRSGWVLGGGRHVERRHAQQHPHLIGGESDSALRVHRLDEVASETTQLPIEALDLEGASA